MKIKMQEAEISLSLSFPNSKVAFIGDTIDDRGQAALDYLKSKGLECHSVRYDPDEFTISLDDVVIHADDVDSALKDYAAHPVVLEASTLGFVEIFLCCRSLRQLGTTQVHLLYVEPENYSRSTRRSVLLSKRDFELSEEVLGYRAFPGAAVLLTEKRPQRGVFFLGYEERRIDQALEDYQMIQASRCMAIFGVPAFKPGWEMDAFVNNIRVIRDKHIRGGIKFCGAENPAAVFNLLHEVYDSLEPEETMFIAPIGTKPHGIGVALFAATHEDVGVIYDHPIRRTGRSEAVSRWHLFSAQL